MAVNPGAVKATTKRRSIVGSDVMAPTQIAVTVSTQIAAKTRRLTQYLRDPYRPERHYMRGPGPKWREKHGELAVRPELEFFPPLTARV